MPTITLVREAQRILCRVVRVIWSSTAQPEAAWAATWPSRITAAWMAVAP